MNAPLLTLDLQFRRQVDKLIPVETQLAELHRLAQHLAGWSPLLSRWCLSSSRSKDEALLHEAFNADGPTNDALAVLREKYHGEEDIRSIAVWNAADDAADASSMASTTSLLGRPDRVDFKMTVNPVVTHWQQGVSLIERALQIWPTLLFATFSPFDYTDHAVFKDRPGVGWMLYPPRILTVQQVPEARALVPVMGEDDLNRRHQIGTVIVSVTDEPFDPTKPAHTRIANAVEIRLVDQDLLPRYADL